MDVKNTTSFQKRCLEEVERALAVLGIEAKFTLSTGREECYYRAQYMFNKHEYDVYLYLDGAGYFVDKKWHIYEWADFKDEEKLIKAFIAGLGG